MAGRKDSWTWLSLRAGRGAEGGLAPGTTAHAARTHAMGSSPAWAPLWGCSGACAGGHTRSCPQPHIWALVAMQPTDLGAQRLLLAWPAGAGRAPVSAMGLGCILTFTEAQEDEG